MAEGLPDVAMTSHPCYFVVAPSQRFIGPVTLQIEDDVPQERSFVPIEFPGGPQVVKIEHFEDDNWVALLRDDESIFAEGRSAAEAVENLVWSALDDLDVLAEYGRNLTQHLLRKRSFLQELFAK